MKIRHLFLYSLVVLTSCNFFSCTHTTPKDSVSEQDTKLDTLISYDQLGGTIVKVVRLHLNDIITSKDTVMIFDPDTYEEQVKINTIRGPRQEVVSMEYIEKK